MTRKEKAIGILLTVLVLALAELGGRALDNYLTRKEWEARAVAIPMANQHITWEGAGYNGIWGGAGK